MTNDSEPVPEPIDAQPFMLPPTLNADSIVLSDAGNHDIRGTWDFTTPSPDSGHEQLSKFVYDLTRRIEARNMAIAQRTEGGWKHESEFLEELIAMVVKAPLSQSYAARLAFAPPADITGTGPHTLVAKSGQKARCGGPGLCRWCTEGEP